MALSSRLGKSASHASIAGSRSELGLSPEESMRRQRAWEREIEALDQQESEVHQTQLRLLREQTAIFLKDMGALQYEVSALRPLREILQNSSFLERLEYLERAMQERKAPDISAAQLQDRCSALEKAHRLCNHRQGNYERQSDELREALERMQQDLTGNRSKLDQMNSRIGEQHLQLVQCATVPERLAFVEKQISDSSERLREDFSNTEIKVEQLLQRMKAAEKSVIGLQNSKAEQRLTGLEVALEELRNRLPEDDGQFGSCGGVSHFHDFGDLRNRLDTLEGKLAPLPAKCNELQMAVHRLTTSTSKDVKKDGEKDAMGTTPTDVANKEQSSLQNSIGKLEKLIKEEISARAKDSKELWAALHGHTHDLSSQIIQGPNSSASPRGQPLTMAGQSITSLQQVWPSFQQPLNQHPSPNQVQQQPHSQPQQSQQPQQQQPQTQLQQSQQPQPHSQRQQPQQQQQHQQTHQVLVEPTATAASPCCTPSPEVTLRAASPTAVGFARPTIHYPSTTAVSVPVPIQAIPNGSPPRTIWRLASPPLQQQQQQQQQTPLIPSRGRGSRSGSPVAVRQVPVHVEASKRSSSAVVHQANVADAGSHTSGSNSARTNTSSSAAVTAAGAASATVAAPHSPPHHHHHHYHHGKGNGSGSGSILMQHQQRLSSSPLRSSLRLGSSASGAGASTSWDSFRCSALPL